ncbi:MAG: PilZ domain-containing protein [Proteobacteria bacterium]|nr:PilZ domain-containing protein [Pseudomonadota bacterium]
MSDALASSEPPTDDPGGKRREQRRRVLLSGKLVHSAGELTVDCAIQDLSATGARIRVPDDTLVGDPIYLINMSHGVAWRARVAWRRDNRLGLAFSHAFDLSQVNEDAPKVLRRLWMEHIR